MAGYYAEIDAIKKQLDEHEKLLRLLVIAQAEKIVEPKPKVEPKPEPEPKPVKEKEKKNG